MMHLPWAWPCFSYLYIIVAALQSRYYQPHFTNEELGLREDLLPDGLILFKSTFIEHPLYVLRCSRHLGSQVWGVTSQERSDRNLRSQGSPPSKLLFPWHYVTLLEVAQCQDYGIFSHFHYFIFCLFHGDQLWGQGNWIELELESRVWLIGVFSMVCRCNKLKCPVLDFMFIYVSARMIQEDPGLDELYHLGEGGCIWMPWAEEQGGIKICRHCVKEEEPMAEPELDWTVGKGLYGLWLLGWGMQSEAWQRVKAVQHTGRNAETAKRIRQSITSRKRDQKWCLWFWRRQICPSIMWPECGLWISSKSFPGDRTCLGIGDQK